MPSGILRLRFGLILAKSELRKAIDEFSQRDRRYGKVRNK